MEAVHEDEVSLAGSARRGVSKTTPICMDQMRVSIGRRCMVTAGVYELSEEVPIGNTGHVEMWNIEKKW